MLGVSPVAAIGISILQPLDSTNRRRKLIIEEEEELNIRIKNYYLLLFLQQFHFHIASIHIASIHIASINESA